MMSKTVSAIEPQKHNKNRYSVFLNGEYAFSLDDETLVKSKIKTGCELSDEDVRYLSEEAEFASCKDAGMKLLSRKRYTCSELSKKLAEKGFSVADEVCGRFCELGLLDDEEYARAFVHDAAVVSGKGERLIKSELKRKGIADSIINSLFDEFDNSDALFSLVEKKFRRKTPDRKTAASVFAACMRKGYQAIHL